ncbi:hypothetical protein F511_45136 [Dorcoceras hygrometricum]|uniref:Uncharacterized protein n=1 Tax=Dorcoceras hygrometricum TaxID=472368 RepID=A0A2Z6ZWT7_9LAMI|nr:hypothetical protein F511_45136 [Dorcoceras hygrometricum]
MEDMLKTDNGITPLRLSNCNCKFFKLIKLPIASGMFPCKGLYDISITSSLDILAMELGIEPVKLLLRRLKNLSSTKASNQEGMSPVKPLNRKSKDLSLRNWANSRGSWPWKPLPLRLTETKNERFPSSDDRFPASPMPETSKALTLRWRELHVTPIHLHVGKESDQFWDKI